MSHIHCLHLLALKEQFVESHSTVVKIPAYQAHSLFKLILKQRLTLSEIVPTQGPYMHVY